MNESAKINVKIFFFSLISLMAERSLTTHWSTHLLERKIGMFNVINVWRVVGGLWALGGLHSILILIPTVFPCRSLMRL